MDTYLTTMSIWLCLSVAVSSAIPAASELLDRYAETQDKLKSFILKSEDEFTAEYDLRFLPNQGERRRGAGGYLGEVRSDGTRHYRSEKLWEKRSAYLPATKSAAQSDPRYNSYLWDAKRVFQYQRSNKTAANDRLFLTPEAHEEARGEHIISTNRSGVLLGYFADTFDRAPYNFRRIDNELKQAVRLEVLQATEPVRGSQCYVIVAQTAESRYKLWIDPQHSFHIARAEITRGGPGVKLGNREEISLHTYLKNVRFEKFGNVWMPVEADWGYQKKFINNGFSRADYHHKIVEFTLSPDHKLLRSFETDEIRNGTSVLIIGDRAGSYTWQDGKVVDKEGNVVLDCMPKKPSDSPKDALPAAKETRPGLWEIVQKYAGQKTAGATPALKQRVVHFPADRSIGKLMIQDENARRDIKSFHYWTEAGDSEWEHLGQAQGDVNVPAGVRLALTVGTGAWKDLSGLFALNPDDLHMLSIYGPPAGGPSPGGPLPGDECMPCIAHLTGLKILYLGNMNVTERGLQSLRPLKTLERLTLPKQVTGQTLAEIAGLSTLKALYLDESRLTDEGLVQIQKLTNLEELSLGQGRMTNAALTHLAKLPRLRYLMLQGKGWTDSSMAYLKDIPSLKILHLGHLTQLTDAALAHLCEVPNLENLSLHWNQNITDEGIAYLAGMPHLKKLDIWHSQVTDEGLAHLAKIRTLEHLDLPACRRTEKGIDRPITDKGIAYLGQLKGLKRLHISALSSGNPFSDKSLQVIGSLQLLEELAISGQASS